MSNNATQRARDLRLALEATGRYGPIDAVDPHDGSVQAEVERLLAAALVPSPGRVRLEDGSDVKVLGELQRTADGVAVVPDCQIILWCPVNLSDPSKGYTGEAGRVRMYSDGTYAHGADRINQCWPVERCYSTRQAADAARAKEQQ